MSDQPFVDPQTGEAYPQEERPYTVLPVGPDEIVIVVRGPLALQAIEKLGEVIQNMMNYQPRRGGGNWGGKEGDERGLFKVVPPLNIFKVGDRFKTPIIGYSVKKGNGSDSEGKPYADRLLLYSPYNQAAELVDPAKAFGIAVGSIQFKSKKWNEIKFFDGRKFVSDNKVHPLNLRMATWKVGQDDKNPEKRFHFLLAIQEAESQDPEMLKYTDPASLTSETPASATTPPAPERPEEEIPY